jgi:hypothetical protein
MRYTAALCGILLAGLSLTPKKIDRGSLVVGMFSRKGEYIVVGAESRRSHLSGVETDDLGCKVISLDGKALFFDAGVTYIKARAGLDWDTQSVARDVYQKSKTRAAAELSAAWADDARDWFSGWTPEAMQEFAQGGDSIVLGGFVTFTDRGIPAVWVQLISYSETDGVTAEPASPPLSGIGMMYGMATDVVQEFFDGKTERAVRAFGPVGAVRRFGADPMVDAGVVKKAIQFAIDHNDQDKTELGGPIDVAILRKNQTIEWVSRKKECYEQDLKSAAAKNVKLAK